VYRGLRPNESGVAKNKKHQQIPPIQFFKSHAVVSNTNLVENTFTSSGTTGLTTNTLSNRYFYLYGKLPKGFSQFYGNIEDYVVLALLSYLEREGSSLIYMVEDLIQSNHDESGFYLHNHDELIKINRIRPVRSKCNSDRSLTFIGPHRKHQFQLQNTIIMETGGMKGRRKNDSG
jgi:hypothetical protein